MATHQSSDSLISFHNLSMFVAYKIFSKYFVIAKASLFLVFNSFLRLYKLDPAARQYISQFYFNSNFNFTHHKTKKYPQYYHAGIIQVHNKR